MSDIPNTESSELPALLLNQAISRLEQVQTALKTAAPSLGTAVERLLATCLAGQRVLLCPLPGAESLAERAASLLWRGMLQPRPGLPVILLQPPRGDDLQPLPPIASLAVPGDILWVLADTHLEALDQVLETARHYELRLILLGNPQLEKTASRLRGEDLVIPLFTSCPASLKEALLAAVHALCDALDHRLLGLA